jgi:hypothetical protein
MASQESKDFHIFAWARPEYGRGSASVGIVCKPTRMESIVEVKESRGKVLRVRKRQSGTGWNYARNGLVSREGERIRLHRCNSSTLQLAGFRASNTDGDLLKSVRAMSKTIPPISSVQVRP